MFRMKPQKLLMEISEFSKGSIVKVSGSFIYDDELCSIESKQDLISDRYRYYSDDGFSCLIYADPLGNLRRGFTTKYRGQEFENRLIDFPGCDVVVDIMSSSASYWISFNREKLVEGRNRELLKNVIKAVNYYIEMKLSDGVDDDLLNRFSMFSQLMKHHPCIDLESWESLSVHPLLRDRWLSADVKNGFEFIEEDDSYEAIRFEDVLSMEGREIVFLYAHDKKPEGDVVSLICRANMDYIKLVIFHSWINKSKDNHVYIDFFDGKNQYTLMSNTESKDDSLYHFSSDKELAHCLTEYRGVGRVIVPAIPGFECLALKQDFRIAANHLYDIPTQGESYMVLPYIFYDTAGPRTCVRSDIDAGSDMKLAEWAQENIAVKMDVNSIVDKYRSLYDLLENLIKEQGFGERWDLQKQKRS